MRSAVIEADEIDIFQESLKNFPLIPWKESTIDCRHLLHLTITNSSISSIHFLHSLVSMEYLNLSFNQILDIHPLSALSCLKVLDISHNKIIDLSPLQTSIELRILRFHKNLIESLDPIRELTQLVELWTSRNQIEIFELFNLLILKNLQHIVVEGNPLESKPKHLEFIIAISPGLFSVNGVPVRSIFPPLGSLNHPTDFFRTVDGRLMLTQARSRLTDSQKEFLLRYQLFPTKTMAISNMLDDYSLQSSTHSGIAQGGEPERLLTSQSENSKHGKIKYFKAKKKHSLPKKFVSTESNLVEDLQLQSVETIFDPESAKTATVIRFGDASTSPVALVLENNGTGYARWGENGPIACSFDGKRLFSSYRNGGIAVILDTNGDGSIMNPRGNCVVTIRENDGDLVADILSEEDGRLVSRYLKSDPKETERHRWNFQGLMIFFFPDSWEVVVQVANSVVHCQFSSISGGTILPDSVVTPNLRPPEQLPRPSKSKSKIASKECITAENHEEIRSGLQSIVSSLDDMLAGMKKKRS